MSLSLVSVFRVLLMNFLIFRALYDLCSRNSRHTIGCSLCLDPGTVNSVIMDLNAETVLPRDVALQKFISACAQKLTAKDRPSGGPGFRKFSYCFVTFSSVTV